MQKHIHLKETNFNLGKDRTMRKHAKKKLFIYILEFLLTIKIKSTSKGNCETSPEVLLKDNRVSFFLWEEQEEEKSFIDRNPFTNI